MNARSIFPSGKMPPRDSIHKGAAEILTRLTSSSTDRLYSDDNTCIIVSRRSFVGRYSEICLYPRAPPYIAYRPSSYNTSTSLSILLHGSLTVYPPERSTRRGEIVGRNATPPKPIPPRSRIVKSQPNGERDRYNMSRYVASEFGRWPKCYAGRERRFSPKPNPGVTKIEIGERNRGASGRACATASVAGRRRIVVSAQSRRVSLSRACVFLSLSLSVRLSLSPELSHLRSRAPRAPHPQHQGFTNRLDDIRLWNCQSIDRRSARYYRGSPPTFRRPFVNLSLLYRADDASETWYIA